MKIMTKMVAVFGLCMFINACASNDYDGLEPASGQEGSYIRPYSKTYNGQNPRRDAPSSSGKNASSELMDPMKAHMMARRQVNPNDTRARRSYTQKTTPQGVRTASSSRRIVKRNIITNIPIPEEKPYTQLAATGSMANMIAAPVQADNNAPTPPTYKPLTRPVPDNNTTTVQTLGYIVPKTKPVLTRASTTSRSGSSKQANTIIEAIRVGDHHDKTRIVFDTTQKPDFKPMLSSSRTAILATFGDTYWGSQLSKSYPESPLLRSYSAKNKDGDTMVNLSFKRPVRVSASTIYAPESPGQKYRVVMDVVPQ